MRAKNGFTLIEILVVIGVIGILAAMAFPVYKHIEGRGQIVECTNNQRQIWLAVKGYCDLNNAGRFPVNYDQGSDITKDNVAQGLAGYYGVYPFKRIPPLWHAIGSSDRMLICPSDDKIWELPLGRDNGWSEPCRAGEDASIDWAAQKSRQALRANNVSYCFAWGMDPTKSRYSVTPFMADDDGGADGTIFSGYNDTSPHFQQGDDFGIATFNDGHTKSISGKKGVYDKMGYTRDGEFVHDATVRSGLIN